MVMMIRSANGVSYLNESFLRSEDVNVEFELLFEQTDTVVGAQRVVWMRRMVGPQRSGR